MTNRRQILCASKTLRRVVLFESPKAVSICPFGCLDPQHRSSIWLPKSVVTVVDEKDGYSEITIPGWLVKKHDLADAPFEESKGGSADNCRCLREMLEGRRKHEQQATTEVTKIDKSTQPESKTKPEIDLPF